MKTLFAAIDNFDPVTGAVYGLGVTAVDAIQDANRYRLNTGSYRVVPITPEAYAHVQDWGGAPSKLLSVSLAGVELNTTEE